jgi:hypothetical protein
MTCYFGFVTLAVAPCRFRGNSPIEPRALRPLISFICFIPYVTFCIFHSIVVFPTSPQKGDSISDPSSLGLQKFIAKSAPSGLRVLQVVIHQAIHRLILVAVAPLQVLKRGIVSLIHVSSLVQPRHLHLLASSNFPQVILESSIGQSLMSQFLSYKSSKGG